MPDEKFEGLITAGRERGREVWTGVAVKRCSPADLEAAARAGYEPAGEYFIGRDPRDMTADEIAALGHEPMGPLQAIRAKCLDCCAGSVHEVRCCAAVACHPGRFGPARTRGARLPPRRNARMGHRLLRNVARSASKQQSLCDLERGKVRAATRGRNRLETSEKGGILLNAIGLPIRPPYALLPEQGICHPGRLRTRVVSRPRATWRCGASF
jgi:hypothetical protein